MRPVEDSAPVLLVGRDLNAVARVEAAASATGRSVLRTDVVGLPAALRDRSPALILVDLDEGGEEALASLSDAVASGSVANGAIVTYFSHVDEELGRRAVDLGFKALPRGRFWRELPALVARTT